MRSTNLLKIQITCIYFNQAGCFAAAEKKYMKYITLKNRLKYLSLRSFLSGISVVIII